MGQILARFWPTLTNVCVFIRSKPGEQLNTGVNVFRFVSGHPCLQAVLAGLAKEYIPTNWGIMGKLMSQHVKKIYNVTMAKDIPTSTDFTIIPMNRFLPVFHMRVVNTLWPEVGVPFDVWRIIFTNSSAIHFNNKITRGLAVPDDPQFSAYALLGPRLCPLAYYSSRNF